MPEHTREKLRRVQALLRREIPDGDVALIFETRSGSATGNDAPSSHPTDGDARS
jgi:hypothetical protein